MKIYVCPTDNSKMARAKAWLKNRWTDVSEWCRENKAIAIPVAISAGGFIIKTVVKHVNLSRAEDLKDLYVYDTSLGHYWELRKKLSNSQWLEIESRKAAGEKLGDILDDLKVLKK